MMMIMIIIIIIIIIIICITYVYHRTAATLYTPEIRFVSGV